MAHKRTRSTRFPGVYWRESSDPNRKHNGRPDRCYDYCFRENGKLKWVCVGWLSEGFSEQKAANLRRETLVKIANGEKSAKDSQEKRTLNSLAESYFTWMDNEGKHLKPEMSRYDTHVRHTIGETPVKLITPEKTAALKSALLKGSSPATAKKVLSICRAIINHAARNQLWDGINPFGKDRLQMPSPQNKGERFLSPDEARSLLAELEKRSPALRDMAWLSLKTGLRSTEIFRLTGADVDILGGVLWVTEKGMRRVAVKVEKAVLETVSKYGRAPEEYIFQGKGGAKLKEISDTFDRACVACGLTPKDKEKKKQQDSRKRVWFHVLRHTFASWLAQSGQVTLQELRDLLRHKTIAMTERYAHLIPENSQAKTAIIGEILAGNRPETPGGS